MYRLSTQAFQMILFTLPIFRTSSYASVILVLENHFVSGKVEAAAHNIERVLDMG
jgi:hypothetical protein